MVAFRATSYSLALRGARSYPRRRDRFATVTTRSTFVGQWWTILPSRLRHDTILRRTLAEHAARGAPRPCAPHTPTAPAGDFSTSPPPTRTPGRLPIPHPPPAFPPAHHCPLHSPTTYRRLCQDRPPLPLPYPISPRACRTISFWFCHSGMGHPLDSPISRATPPARLRVWTAAFCHRTTTRCVCLDGWRRAWFCDAHASYTRHRICVCRGTALP